MPNRNGLGTPSRNSPPATTQPKPKLVASCVKKYRLSRSAASSIAAVVRCKSLLPNSRIIRSRRSSICMRMKIATTSTMNSELSGETTGSANRSTI